MGPKLTDRCKLELVGTKEYSKMLYEFRSLKMAGLLPRRQETGRLKDQK